MHSSRWGRGVRRGRTRVLLFVLVLTGCAEREETETTGESADTRVVALADEYLAAYFDRFPDQVTVFGVPGRTHDRLPDNSPRALAEWHAREDAWLSAVVALTPSTIEAPALRATYAILREALESAIGARVCHPEWWPVSQMTGWQAGFSYLATIQPVGSPAARAEALSRWSALPAFLDVEIQQLRTGLQQGFSSPRHIVRIVIEQVTALVLASTNHPPAATEDASPFLSPAQRDEDERFRQSFTDLVESRLVPAFRRYRDFLETEYLPAARDAIAVAALPDGRACYDALVRQHSSLPMTASEVHRVGLAQMDRLMGEMRTIAERGFHTSDVGRLLARLRTDRQFMFRDRADLIDYTRAAVGRARAAAPAWFGRLPQADVAIEPYPSFREKNGANEYNPPAEDGSRPGLFYISAYQADRTSRAIAEATAFHETIPGHHLQTALALEQPGIHPLGRYLYNSGYSEGWGLYAERLADEMGLYSGDLDRLGMLGSQALRAARLVVDSGMHAQGWSRDEALAYLLAHTAEARDYLASEVDRYIIWPGQATSYMLGLIEIQRAREEAERRLGSRFSRLRFHDRVLAQGSVPLTFLSAQLRQIE
ncbi:MAG: DUF885 family protein [Vicinamibacterales bacterium]